MEQKRCCRIKNRFLVCQHLFIAGGGLFCNGGWIGWGLCPLAGWMCFRYRRVFLIIILHGFFCFTAILGTAENFEGLFSIAGRCFGYNKEFYKKSSKSSRYKWGTFPRNLISVPKAASKLSKQWGTKSKSIPPVPKPTRGRQNNGERNLNPSHLYLNRLTRPANHCDEQINI